MSPLKVHRATEDRTWWASLIHRIAGSQSQLNDMQHTQSSVRAIPTFSPSLYTCSHNKFPSIKKKKSPAGSSRTLYMLCSCIHHRHFSFYFPMSSFLRLKIKYALYKALITRPILNPQILCFLYPDLMVL